MIGLLSISLCVGISFGLMVRRKPWKTNCPKWFKMFIWHIFRLSQANTHKSSWLIINKTGRTKHEKYPHRTFFFPASPRPPSSFLPIRIPQEIGTRQNISNQKNLRQSRTKNESASFSNFYASTCELQMYLSIYTLNCVSVSVRVCVCACCICISSLRISKMMALLIKWQFNNFTASKQIFAQRWHFSPSRSATCRPQMLSLSHCGQLKICEYLFDFSDKCFLFRVMARVICLCSGPVYKL